MQLSFDKNIWTCKPCNFVPTVQIFITNQCNRRCEGCFNIDRLGDTHMSLVLYKQLVKQYKPLIKKVILMGGEPLLHPDIKEMIHINQSNDLRTTIYTNGTLQHILEDIDLSNVTIRVGVLGLDTGEKQIVDVHSGIIPYDLVYMLRRMNVHQLKSTVEFAETNHNCKKVMLSSIRNIGDSGDYWIDGKGDLSHREYFNVVQEFVDTYNGNLNELQISIRGGMEVEGGEWNTCRFVNIFPNGDKIICPFDISKNKVEDEDFIFPNRECNKHHKCLLQKIILTKNNC